MQSAWCEQFPKTAAGLRALYWPCRAAVVGACGPRYGATVKDSFGAGGAGAGADDKGTVVQMTTLDRTTSNDALKPTSEV